MTWLRLTCGKCGFAGEAGRFARVRRDGHLVRSCPKCGSTKLRKESVQ